MLFRISKRKRIAIMIPVLAAIIVAVIMKGTPLEKAYRICGDCGVESLTVDSLMIDYVKSGASPEVAMQLFMNTTLPVTPDMCE